MLISNFFQSSLNEEKIYQQQSHEMIGSGGSGEVSNKKVLYLTQAEVRLNNFSFNFGKTLEHIKHVQKKEQIFFEKKSKF